MILLHRGGQTDAMVNTAISDCARVDARRPMDSMNVLAGLAPQKGFLRFGKIADSAVSDSADAHGQDSHAKRAQLTS